MSHDQPQLELVIEFEASIATTQSKSAFSIIFTRSISPILTKFHAGYFRISLSLCCQALLWKTLSEPPKDDAHTIRRMLGMLPSTAFLLLWSLALFSLVSLSLLYILRSLFYFEMVKDEFLHHVGVNYSFAPWISCLLLLQSTPFIDPNSVYYQLFWWIFVVPILGLDVKIYGQWFTKGKRFLSKVANPTSQLSVIGNLVGAQAAAQMGWRECAVCMFSLGMAHYLVLFVTLYQRWSGSNTDLPVMLRPVFFLFFAAPSMASLAWTSISGTFDNSSRILFFLSIFLFMSLASSATTQSKSAFSIIFTRSISPILTKFHAGYFRISLSLCCQALLWKTLSEPPKDAHTIRRVLGMLPSTAFLLLWSLALFSLVSLSLLYILRSLFYFEMVKDEFLHHVGVNYSFAPWISCLLLLQSTPFIDPNSVYYQLLWWIFVVPILVLDVKIYGQWFTKGKRFLSKVANPTSQLSVIGNLVGAQAAAQMGWRECAVCMFSLGMAHYLVLFVTLYQRWSGSNTDLPVMLRPVFFLFFAAPSMASLAWTSISGTFDNSSRILFFLSIFLFMSLVCRPILFKKSMKKFNVAWWAYSFPLTMLALASAEYAQEVKGGAAHALMLVLSALSVIVSLILMVFTALNSHLLLVDNESL